MQQRINGILIDTDRLKPLYLFHNQLPPDSPFYQRFTVYQGVNVYIVWVRTGIRRGGLNQLVALDRPSLTTLHQTMTRDRRHSLARILKTLAA